MTTHPPSARWFIPASMALAFVAAGADAQPTRTVLPQRPDAFVAATRWFTFHSDIRVNLHDVLVASLSPEPRVAVDAGCLASRPATERTAFEAAAARYRERYAGADPGHTRELLDVRYHLAGWPEVSIVEDEPVAATVASVEAAVPAYRACGWEDHDARNRRWVGELLPLLVAHEADIGTAIADVVGRDWTLPVSVDVAAHVNFSGANTVVNPDHVLISSIRPELAGLASLEMVFHEASHSILSPRSGPIPEALGRAARALGMDAPPGAGWHILLFYTSGWATAEALRAAGHTYVPYLDAGDLYVRAWPEWREPLAQHWLPHLEGRRSLDDAVLGLLRAVAAAGG